MNRFNMLTVILCLMSAVVDINAEETNNVSLNDDIIVSAETGGTVWINDSTLFEAPIIKIRPADNVSRARISSSQNINLHTNSFYNLTEFNYTCHNPATIFISLDEFGNIAGSKILICPFPRSIAQGYVDDLKENKYFTPAKINGIPVKSVGIWVFEMGPQQLWRAGGPIETAKKTVSFTWSPLIE